MSTFKLEDVIPVVENVIGILTARKRFADRRSIVGALIKDPAGRKQLSRARPTGTAPRNERKVAGNMVDWFSAKYTVKDDLTKSARRKFDREKVGETWLYFKRGVPASRRSKAITTGVKSGKGSASKRVKSRSGSAYSYPRAFISYSHDSSDHKQWVLRLAENLQNNGVDVSLDQWDLPLGGDAAMYMERAVRDSDWVIIICTRKYVKKANTGKGGAGYEKMIMTAELVRDQTKSKFIPVVRMKALQPVPTFLETKLYIDFTNDKTYAESVDSLLRDILSAPKTTKPRIGKNPFGSAGTGRPKIA